MLVSPLRRPKTALFVNCNLPLLPPPTHTLPVPRVCQDTGASSVASALPNHGLISSVALAYGSFMQVGLGGGFVGCRKQLDSIYFPASTGMYSIYLC